ARPAETGPLLRIAGHAANLVEDAVVVRVLVEHPAHQDFAVQTRAEFRLVAVHRPVIHAEDLPNALHVERRQPPLSIQSLVQPNEELLQAERVRLVEIEPTNLWSVGIIGQPYGDGLRVAGLREFARDNLQLAPGGHVDDLPNV